MYNVQKVIKTVEDRIKELPQNKVESLEKAARADNDFEVFKYQDTQAQAHAMQYIDFDTANWLYNILGRNCPSKATFNKRPLAERIVAMEIITACMSRLIGLRSKA